VITFPVAESLAMSLCGILATKCRSAELSYPTFQMTMCCAYDTNICVLTLYRAPSGNFDNFLLKLDTIFHHYTHPIYTS